MIQGQPVPAQAAQLPGKGRLLRVTRHPRQHQGIRLRCAAGCQQMAAVQRREMQEGCVPFASNDRT